MTQFIYWEKDTNLLWTIRNIFKKLINSLKIISKQQFGYNFDPLVPQFFNQQYISDTGWGCMLRVGQMMFAEVLKRFIFPKQFKQKSITQQELNTIIDFFKDNNNSQFSIQKISQVAYDELNMKPGQWYNPADIVFCLKELNKDFKFQQKKLNFLIFKENMIQLDKILEQFDCQQCYLEDNITQRESFMVMENTQFQCQKCQENQTSVLILIITRLGLDNINQIYLQSLQELMNLKQFTGMLGGKNNNAHYFFGNIKNNLIYLDPHCSQEQQTYQSYSTNPRLYPINNISPSLCLSYYFEKPKDAYECFQSFNKIKSLNQDFFLCLDVKTPQYMMDSSEKAQRTIIEGDEEWEIL